MEREKTCGNCPKRESAHVMGAGIPHCGDTGFVVPHASGEGELVFWRVPMSCPRPDTEVEKSEERAPKKDWITTRG